MKLAGTAAILFAACTPAHADTYKAGDTMIPTFAIGADLHVTPNVRPARGDVIVFRFPGKPGTYVKRVIGVAGDTVEVVADGAGVVVNGTPIPRCHLGPWGYETHHGDVWLEGIGGKQWRVFHDAAGIHPGHPGSWTVRFGTVFVLGDNRENSTDSRMWGGLALDEIVGVVEEPPGAPPGCELPDKHLR